MKRLEVKIFGDVQGVTFRAFAAREARSRRLVGTVRNLPDGSVEVVAEGAEHDLEAFLLRLQVGPRFGRVDRVEEQWGDAKGAHADFRVVF